MQVAKLINIHRGEIETAAKTMQTMDEVYAFFIAKWGEDVTEYELNQPAIIRQQLKAVCPKIKR